MWMRSRGNLEIVWCKAGVPRYAREHLGADFISIMEGKNVVWIALLGQDAV